jgi:hypothetical protein
MRFGWRSLIATAVGLLLAPQLAAAEDVQEQLRRMQERMSQLEDKLDATSDELAATKQRADAQQKVIQEAGLADDRPTTSRLVRFLEQTEFAGWVAVSYFYNTNGPDSGEGDDANVGRFGTANPFHPDHNSFQVDQVWFSMEKPVSPESRAGFGVDIGYGKTADLLREADSMNGNLPAVHQAYVQYLAPIGGGITVKAGRFATLIGAEVAETPYNFNITRGLVYSTLQPINHVGLLLSSEYQCGVDWALGVANSSLLNANTDTDNDKALLWHLGFAPNDTLALGVSGVWGGDHPLGNGVSGANRNGDKTGIVDFVLNWDPSDALSTWVNLDYVWSQEDWAGWNSQAYGVAAAGRLALTDKTGVALRAEFIEFIDQFLYGGGGPTDQRLWSLTGTLDHSLTDNLLLRVEVRYEEGNQEDGPDDFYLDDEDGDWDEEQVLVGAELIYTF